MNIKVEEFNSAPGKESLEQYLKTTKLNAVLEVADAHRTYFQNENDTLVLRVKENAELTFKNGMDLQGLARKYDVDELHDIKEQGRTYYRFWWD